MFIRLKSGIRHDGQDWSKGSQLNLSEEDAERLVRLGVAYKVGDVKEELVVPPDDPNDPDDINEDDDPNDPDDFSEDDDDPNGDDVDILTLEEFSALKEKDMEQELARLRLPFKAKDTKPTLIAIYENYLKSQQ